MAPVDNVEADLNRSVTYYDLIYFDFDGRWKRVNAEIACGKPIPTFKDAEEYLKLYRKGREDWNLRIACMTEHVFVDVV